MKLVVLKKAMWLGLDVRHLGNFCLGLPPRCFHCAQKVTFSGVLGGSETWAVKEEDLANLERNDIMTSPGVGKCKKLHTQSGRLRWFERMDKISWVQCREIVVEGCLREEREGKCKGKKWIPKKTRNT